MSTPAEAAPVVSSEPSSAPTIDNEIAQMMGDYTDNSGETPEPVVTSDEGTTPLVPDAGTVKEGDGTTAPADVSATASDGTTPATPTPALEAEDPFADTTPATFMVNGAPVTNEDIRVFKEGGAVIRPEALPDVLNKLSERESLFERNRQQSQEYTTLSKVTEWTDAGSGKSFTGVEAAIEMRSSLAAALAENKLLLDVLDDPEKLYSILTTEQVPDGKGGLVERVIFNPAERQKLVRENDLTVREIRTAIKDHYKDIVAESSKPQPAPVNYEQATPELLKQIAAGASLDASVLTADDRKLLAEQLPFHTKDGLASVAWQNLAKSMMKDRAREKANTQSVVSATEKATKEGQARMLQAARGVKSTTTRPAPTTAPKKVTQDTSRAESEGDAWDIQERATARAMRQSV